MHDEEYARMFACEDRHWWYVALHERIERLVATESRRHGPLRIYDAGCGTGGLMNRLQRYGRVEGCDASPLALAACAQRGLREACLQDLNTLELPDRMYDVIVCADVLEHRGIDSEVEVLRRLGSGLKPGGLLVLNCTALTWLRSAHDEAVGSVRRYSRSQLRELLHRSGLSQIRVDYRLFLLLPAIALYRAFRRPDHTPPHSDVWMPPAMLNHLLLTFSRIDAWMARGIRIPAGSSVFATARRSSR